MRYCTHCKTIFNDNVTVCKKCGKKTISNPNHYSPINIITANGFELERIKASLSDSDIPFSVQETQQDTGLQILNSAPPENCNVFVPLSSYDDAVSVLVGIGALKDNEIPEIDEQTQSYIKKSKKNAQETQLSPKKARIVRILSFIGFLLVLVGVVYLTDFLISFIKPLFGW